MKEEIQKYIDKYPVEIVEMFIILRQLIFDSVSCDVVETMWAKLPSYYVDEKFVRLILFKDHINIEAKTMLQYKEVLNDFKITPKGMLQIYVNQDIPNEILVQIFAETLGGKE